MSGLKLADIAENLEILRAETRMLRIIVSGLLINASPEARGYAISLISEAAAAEPRFAARGAEAEMARRFITDLASSWIAMLSRG